MSASEIYSMHKELIIDEIHSILRENLTIGRKNNNQKIYTEKKITEFIDDHEEEINNVVEEMIDTYNENGDLESLKEPNIYWIKEYLYTHIGIEYMYKSSDTRGILRGYMENKICSDLTSVSRKKMGLCQYTEDELNDFIKDNHDKIEEAITMVLENNAWPSMYEYLYRVINV